MHVYLKVILFVGAATLLPLAVAHLITSWLQHRRRGFRSPLTGQLLRAPGEKLMKTIENLNLELDSYLAAFVLLPFIFVFLYVVQPQLFKDLSNTIIFAGSFFLTFSWLTWKIIGLLNVRHKCRLGLDGERAVGQELNQLMLKGCRVYHDFPAEGFNIDHIVIGPGGVFAVETKARAKPDKGRGNKDVRVKYDGKALIFPDWKETRPLVQAERQAKWLGRWISSAVGEKVDVKPVVALPGWYVHRTRRGGVIVINGKEVHFMAGQPFGNRLSEKLIQRIAHQVEQRCRDVGPVAFQYRENGQRDLPR